MTVTALPVRLTQSRAEEIDVPPAPTAKAVLDHRKKLEIERDGLRTGTAVLALSSALGDPDAKAALAAIPAKLAALQFEIDLNHEAYELSVKQDSDAERAWRASLHEMDPEIVIAGLNRDECPKLCQVNCPGGCVIAGGFPYAGSQCCHPVREQQSVFCRDQNGDRQFLYRRHPRAAEVFEAARRRLKVPTR
jgi:hypothetical protein